MSEYHKKDFEYYLKIECAMSPNTVASYISDLTAFFSAEKNAVKSEMYDATVFGDIAHSILR